MHKYMIFPTLMIAAIFFQSKSLKGAMYLLKTPQALSIANHADQVHSENFDTSNFLLLFGKPVQNQTDRRSDLNHDGFLNILDGVLLLGSTGATPVCSLTPAPLSDVISGVEFLELIWDIDYGNPPSGVLPPTLLRGDIDGDGDVDQTDLDISISLLFTSQVADQQGERADLNDDDALNMKDAILLTNIQRQAGRIQPVVGLVQDGFHLTETSAFASPTIFTLTAFNSGNGLSTCASPPVTFLYPPIIEDQSFSINERVLLGTEVGAVIATDPDSGAGLMFSILSGNLNNTFALDQNSGILRTQGDINYDIRPEYFLEVQITDIDGLSATGLVTVLVQDVNDPPEITILDPDGVSDTADISFIISWADHDPDDDANVALFFDTDGAGGNGTEIVNGLSEDDPMDQFVWNTSSLASGDYYVYAIIEDAMNDPVTVYSPWPVTVSHTLVDFTFALTDVLHARPNTAYTSNTITVSNLANAMSVSLSGGLNSTLLKNGLNSGATTTVDNGDTLAIRTDSPASGSSDITLTIGPLMDTWTLTTDAISPLPPISGTMSGYTMGEFNVNPQGAANYSIPITVAPGTAGLEPKLSLNYSSRGGNGLLGMGWSLNGLSTISRSPATLAQDNLIDSVDFDENDKFSLDGERLIAIAGDYGADGAEYRTEHDIFNRVVSNGTGGNSNDPQSFTVYTKSGLIMEYGATNDARIEAQGRDEAMFWAVNKISDSFGNYMTISYVEDNANSSFRPLQILYTYHPNQTLPVFASVNFTYEERPDAAPRYMAGSKVLLTHRLTNVMAKQFGSPFREYRLTYGLDAFTSRSHLSSLTECGADGVCFSPTTFDWQSPLLTNESRLDSRSPDSSALSNPGFLPNLEGTAALLLQADSPPKLSSAARSPVFPEAGKPNLAFNITEKIVSVNQSANASQNQRLGVSCFDGFPGTIFLGDNGPNSINGTSGQDRICGFDGNDTISAKEGDDFISGGTGNDNLRGDNGNDTLNGNGGDDDLSGGNHNDILKGGGDSDNLNGESGDDILLGQRGNDHVMGGSGNDTYVFEQGADHGSDIFIDSSGSNDRIWFRGLATPQNAVYAKSGNHLIITNIGGQITVENYYSSGKIERFYFDSATGAPSLSDVPPDNTPFGSFTATEDGVTGWAYDANSNGPISVDVYVDGGFYQRITAGQSRPDVLAAGETPLETVGFSYTFSPGLPIGVHTIQVYALNDNPSTGNNPLLGTQQVSVTNDDPYGALETINFESVSGWAYDPDQNPISVHVYVDNILQPNAAIASNPRPDLTPGVVPISTVGFTHIFSPGLTPGDHTVQAFAINAPPGTNPIIGSKTATIGSEDDDILENSMDADYVYGAGGADTILGNDSSDTLSGGDGDDRISGLGGNDLIGGNLGNDHLNGNMGDDEVRGGQGNDSVHGGAGNDWVKGNDGDDEIYGNLGDDTLEGSAGNDYFFYRAGDGNDTITDAQGNNTLVLYLFEQFVSLSMSGTNKIVTINAPVGNGVITVINDIANPINIEYRGGGVSQDDVVDFSMTNTVPGLEGHGFSGDGYDNEVIPSDFNGDGLTDILTLPRNGSGNWMGLAQGDGGFSYTSPVAGLSGLNLSTGDNRHLDRILSGDVNADGNSDLILLRSTGNHIICLSEGDGGFTQLTTAQEIGDIFGKTFRTTNPTAGWVTTGDFNGDGATDILALGNTPSATHDWLALSNLDGSFSLSPTPPPNGGFWEGDKSENSRLLAADFNGDGLTDIIQLMYSFGNRTWRAYSNGDGTFDFADLEPQLEPLTYWRENTQIVVGDFNGDGISDLAKVQTDGDNWVALFKGMGAEIVHFNNPFGLTGASFIGMHSQVRVTDLNGDGNSDVLILENTGDHIALVSLGDGSFNRIDQVGGLEGALNSGRQNARILSGYFNLDGKADLVNIQSDGNHWVGLSNGFTSGLLTGIVHGHGGEINIEYKPMTDSSIYAKIPSMATCSPANQFRRYVVAPLYLVSQYEKENGVGGFNRFDYQYSGGQMSLGGRGFLGFEQVEVSDNVTSMVTTSTYNVNHRYRHNNLCQTEHRLTNGTLVTKTENELQAIKKEYGDANEKRNIYFAYASKSATTQYEPNTGTLTSKTILESIFDGNVAHSNGHTHYGNLTQSTLTIDPDTATTSDDFTSETRNSYGDNIDDWLLGRLTRTETNKKSPGMPVITRVSEYEYHPTRNAVTKEIFEPGYFAFELTKSYTHDSFGNILTTTVNGADIAPRTHTDVYNDRNRFVVESINALGQNETRDYTQAKLSQVIGPNNLETSWEYDGFGRETLERRPDGTLTRTAYIRCNAGCPPNGEYYIRKDSSGAPPVVTYYDLLNREIRKETIGFNGSKIFVDTNYNSRGQVVAMSEPYFEGDTPLFTTFSYDTIGRATSVTAPGARTTTTSYDGLTTTMTNPLGQQNTSVYSLRKKLLQSADHTGQSVFYKYDSADNLIEMTDSQGNKTEITYDIRGYKTGMTDPDTGGQTYSYNAIGELVEQTRADGSAMSFEYDLLGRMTERTEPEGTSLFTFDLAENGVGKLSQVLGPNGFSERYSYDGLGRQTEAITTIDGVHYSVSGQFDQYGRQESLTYPTGFAVQMHYNNFGYLEHVKRGSDGHSYWQATQVNARRQLERALLGNSLQTVKTYTDTTGRLERIKTGSIQDIAVSFDPIGNLTQRQDLLIGLTEDFTYDNLNRLTGATVAGQPTVNMTYDALGNISSRSDVGAYTYGGGNAGPHAVTSIVGPKANVFSYDLAGNRIGSNNEAVLYTSYNKPHSIVKLDKALQFKYSPKRERFQQTALQNGVIQNVKTYIGGIFERERTAGLQKDTHFIFANDQRIAVYTLENGETGADAYFHSDHIGSIQTISDEQGNVVETLSYDAWGARRDPNTWLADPNSESSFDRGFTDHEMLDEVGLIHMNGRVYDPVIGRFLSPDPFIQAPDFTQSLNRYSYALNNPLSLTDPSGYFSIKDVVKLGIAFAAGYFTGGSALWIASGFKAAFGAAATSLGTSILYGASFSFGSSFASSLLAGQSVGDSLRSGLRSSVLGGISGAALYGIDQVLPNQLKSAPEVRIANGHPPLSLSSRVGMQVARVGARSFVKGAVSELDGGDFKSSLLFNLGAGSIDSIFTAYVEYRFRVENPRELSAKEILQMATTWAPGKGVSDKSDGRSVNCFPCTNVGEANSTNWLTGEKGVVMKFLGENIPGLNSGSIFHDFLAGQLTTDNKLLNLLSNQGTIVPALAGSYLGLLSKGNTAPLQIRNDKENSE